ncbi:TonB-dependent receptor [Sphingorhabdus sp. EL138]|uniref:TonB-dependent receptor n=1 Tax=Sphingorhabdus sp. EL138 TaxID=2073156 RepID=UPI000D68F35D|nr:TonB-dependent receptor [Sphingorhabdus sp. EL138]
MKLTRKKILAAVLATTSLPVTPLMAQIGGDGQAGADQSADSSVIVVTARKTAESLFETPVAVSVISEEFLERTGFVEVGDIVRFVPGFDLTPLNTTRATGSKIRGISTFSFSDGFESSVATVIDGVVLGREAQGFFDFVDVESIEVIKGPQGTLFGKNASAGVINIRTKAPEFEFGGKADISYGTFDEIKIRGTVTGPLVEDKLAARISGTYNTRDGVYDNPIPGEADLNDKEQLSLRAKLLFKPNEDLNITLAGDYVTEENNCCLPTYRVAGDPSPAILFALNPGAVQLQDALAEFGVVPGPENRSVPVFDENILQESEAYGLALTVEQELGDLTLTSISSWRHWEIDEFNEADGVSNSNVNNRNGTVSSTDQYSQELRLDGKVTDNVSIVAGLFYFHQDLDAQGQVDIELALPFPPFFNVRTNADRTVETDSFAIFGETTVDVTDKLSLVLGGRYTNEKLDATYTRVASPILQGAPFGAFFGADVTGSQRVTDENLSGRVIARYIWSDQVMTYLSWSRGYKGPGIDVAESVNVAAITTPGGLPVLPPEIPTLWEAGIRANLFDDALAVNVALYHQDVRDVQGIATDANGVTLNLSIDKIRAKGIEADFFLKPAALPGFTLSGSFTYNDIEINEFAARPDLVGIRYRDNPRFFYSVVGDYRTSLGNSDLEGFLRGEWTWQSSKNTSLARDPTTFVDSYGLLNLRVGLDGPDSRYGITFSVENVFDKDYEHFIFGSTFNALDGTTRSQFLGEERTWNVTLRTKF